MTGAFPSVSFQIEKIIDVVAVEGDVKNFKVQWAPTWVSSLNLIGCEKLIRDFMNQRCENCRCLDGTFGFPMDFNIDRSIDYNITSNNRGTSVFNKELPKIVEVFSKRDVTNESSFQNTKLEKDTSELIPKELPNSMEETYSNVCTTTVSGERKQPLDKVDEIDGNKSKSILNFGSDDQEQDAVECTLPQTVYAADERSSSAMEEKTSVINSEKLKQNLTMQHMNSSAFKDKSQNDMEIEINNKVMLDNEMPFGEKEMSTDEFIKPEQIVTGSLLANSLDVVEDDTLVNVDSQGRYTDTDTEVTPLTIKNLPTDFQIPIDIHLKSEKEASLIHDSPPKLRVLHDAPPNCLENHRSFNMNADLENSVFQESTEILKDQSLFSEDFERQIQQKAEPNSSFRSIESSSYCQKSLNQSKETSDEKKVHGKYKLDTPEMINVDRRKTKRSQKNRPEKEDIGMISKRRKSSFQSNSLNPNKETPQRVISASNGKVKSPPVEGESHCLSPDDGALEDETSSVKQIYQYLPNETKPFYFICSFCDKKFKYELPFYRHQALHLSSKMNTNTCNICLRFFPKKLSLEKHMQKKCEKCQRVFACSLYFKKHLLTHKVKDFSCKFCPEKFTRNRHLLLHMKDSKKCHMMELDMLKNV